MHRVSVLLACIAFLGATSGSTQEMSLKEVARGRGGRATQTSYISSPVKTLGELIAESDAIFEGRIAAAVSRLSPDETRVLTDLTVVPFRVFKADARIDALWKTAKPIVVQIPGGKVVEDRYELESVNHSFPEGVLREGMQVIGFVKYYDHLNSYVFHGGEFGVFRIAAQRVLPLTATVARRRGDQASAVRNL
jgi:hypothetical protein